MKGSSLHDAECPGKISVTFSARRNAEEHAGVATFVCAAWNNARAFDASRERWIEKEKLEDQYRSPHRVGLFVQKQVMNENEGLTQAPNKFINAGCFFS